MKLQEHSPQNLLMPWDKAQALLDMKNYASDVDVASNLIRIHAPDVNCTRKL